jgi:alpha 1,2-mannosyltransferase
LHFILSVSNETYSNATSLDNLRNNVLGAGAYDPVSPGDIPPAQDAGRLPHGQDGAHTTSIHTTTHYSPSKGGASNGTYGANGERRANAAFVLLARNGDLNGVVQSMKQMEDRFNKRYNYPYVFLNEEPFDDAFKKCVRAPGWSRVPAAG